MGYKCCVFGCKFNYQYLRKDKRETLVNVTVISFPKYESLRKEWIKIYQSARVCINHFHKDDVITQIFSNFQISDSIVMNKNIIICV